MTLSNYSDNYVFIIVTKKTLQINYEVIRVKMTIIHVCFLWVFYHNCKLVDNLT